MRTDHEALMLVRAELCERLAAVQRFSTRQSSGNVADAVAGIRHLASAYGLSPVARLAEAFERAARQSGAACPASLYIDRLYDAIGCQRTDDAAGEAMLASVSVRFA